MAERNDRPELLQMQKRIAAGETGVLPLPDGTVGLVPWYFFAPRVARQDPVESDQGLVLVEVEDLNGVGVGELPRRDALALEALQGLLDDAETLPDVLGHADARLDAEREVDVGADQDHSASPSSVCSIISSDRITTSSTVVSQPSVSTCSVLPRHTAPQSPSG